MDEDRRRLLLTFAAALAPAALPRALRAQQERVGATNMPMNENRYLPVRLPPRSATASMSAMQRDALEHRLHCQCGCNLDVFTCRTTDFTCQVSPAMHRDVMALVAGGYGAQEIIDAFTQVYGPRVLMEPPRRGFNLAGYFTPFVVLAAGAALVVVLLRRWRPARAGAAPGAPPAIDATPDELERLRRLVGHDDT